MSDREAEIKLQIEEAEAAADQELSVLSKSHKNQLKCRETTFAQKKSEHEK